MLKDLSREPLARPPAKREKTLIPDPWELSASSSQGKTIPDSWQLPRESQLLITGGEGAGTLRLSSSQSNSVKVLLEDWLKLRAEEAKELAGQLKEAIALLYYLEMAV